MDILIEKPWDYVLKTDGKQYILEVICGRVGMYIKKHPLSNKEINAYKVQGERYIESIARSIQNKNSCQT